MDNTTNTQANDQTTLQDGTLQDDPLQKGRVRTYTARDRTVQEGAARGDAPATLTQDSVVGTFETMWATEDAIRTLAKSAFPIEQVSVVAQDLESEQQVHGFVSVGDVAVRGAGTGAWLGGLFGLLIGAAFVWMPGFGPLLIAGPLAAALLGGLEGAALGAGTGGLLGALTGWGVSRKHVVKYENALQRGHYLLIAHGTPREVAYAHDLLEDTGAVHLDKHDAQVDAETVERLSNTQIAEV